MCGACSCRKGRGRRDVTRIPTTSAAASGIANFTPNLGIQPISSPPFLLLGNSWKTGRGKHIPERDLPLHRISQKRIAKEWLQQNLSLIVFYASLYKPHRPMRPPTFVSFRHSPCIVTLGSHKQASLPSTAIARVDGNGVVELGRKKHLLPCPTWASSYGQHALLRLWATEHTHTHHQPFRFMLNCLLLNPAGVGSSPPNFHRVSSVFLSSTVRHNPVYLWFVSNFYTYMFLASYFVLFRFKRLCNKKVWDHDIHNKNFVIFCIGVKYILRRREHKLQMSENNEFEEIFHHKVNRKVILVTGLGGP